MDFVLYVVKMFNCLCVDVVMVDFGGVGGGVCDCLCQLCVLVYEVDFGVGVDYINEVEFQVKYVNKCVEIWGGVRDWFFGGFIVELIILFLMGINIIFVDELMGLIYGLNNWEEIFFEVKKDMCC